MDKSRRGLLFSFSLTNFSGLEEKGQDYFMLLGRPIYILYESEADFLEGVTVPDWVVGFTGFKVVHDNLGEFGFIYDKATHLEVTYEDIKTFFLHVAEVWASRESGYANNLIFHDNVLDREIYIP